jgi:DNA-binding HxlR family transcriptional regulator
VEYELTESARMLSPVWHAMEQWGDDHKKVYGEVTEDVV